MTPVTIPIVGISLWVIIKIFVLIAIAMYIVFAFVVIRQVKLMTDTLTLELDGYLRILSYVHLAFTILLFLLALIIL